MSAFLGKIHYWLYNKILLHEKLIESVVELASSQGYNCEAMLKESFTKYGHPVTGDLEHNIEHSNIHGWLQERIISVEKRLAYIITELLKNNIVKSEDIAEIFQQNAIAAMKESGIKEGSPQDYFTLIFDNMLEGMPCDRVNEIIESNDSFISWKTTRCLHKDYWDEVGGDIGNFYYFRDAWINGFLNSSGAGYCYSRAEDGVNVIRRI